MAWTYLAASEDSGSESMNGLNQLHIAKSALIAGEFCLSDNTKALSRARRYGIIFGPLKVKVSRSFPISFLEDFHARTSAHAAAVTAWKESEADFSLKSLDSLANFDQDSFSWRTSQLSLFGGFTEFSWRSLRWGTIVDGQLFRPQKLAPNTKGIDGSAWPTPLASRCGYQSQGKGKKKRLMLPQLWTLGKIPIPTARESKASGFNAEMRRNNPSVSTYWKATAGTLIPPSFIEWIMGYSFGHTALKHLGMPWFHSKRKSRLKDSQVSNDKG